MHLDTVHTFEQRGNALKYQLKSRARRRHEQRILDKWSIEALYHQGPCFFECKNKLTQHQTPTKRKNATSPQSNSPATSNDPIHSQSTIIIHHHQQTWPANNHHVQSQAAKLTKSNTRTKSRHFPNRTYEQGNHPGVPNPLS